MYVGGRGAGTDGTVLPTLMVAQAQGLIGEISVAATSKASIDALQTKLADLNFRLGLNVEIKGYPSTDTEDPQAYQKALGDLRLPACAIVVVPDHLHAEITANVIDAGVHPLVVKPLTPTLQEATDLIKLSEAKNVYAAVEFHKRWDETNLLARQAIADRRLGDLRYITVEYSQKRLMRGIFESWLDQTNIFQYLGVHYVDLIYYLTGAKPVRVLATGQPSYPAPVARQNLDSIQALIEWELPASEQRFVSTIATSWIDPNTTSAMSDQKITLVGTEGRYQIDQKNRGAQLVTQDGSVEDVNPYFSQIYRGVDGIPLVHGYGPRSITQFLTDVLAIVSGHCQIADLTHQRPSFYECLPSTAVIESVNRSLQENSSWIEVPNIE